MGKWLRRQMLLLAALVLGISPASAQDRPKMLWVYVGTYNSPKSKGIYRLELDTQTGKLTSKGLVAETINATFLALHPSGKYLYAVNEIGNFKGGRTGAVSAYAVDPATGNLKLLNKQPSGGEGPCHIVVDKVGKNVLVANYGGGSAAVLPIAADGSLKEPSSVVQHRGKSVDPRRQKAPHAHSINLDPDNNYAFVADLGLDLVKVYKYNGDRGTLTADESLDLKVQAGAGPRHFTFHPSGKYAYVINELDSTVTVAKYQAGKLSPLQTISTLPEGYEADTTTAEVVVHPSGRFVYGSNRGFNAITIFRVDEQTGKLTTVGYQGRGVRVPRNFSIEPSGRWMLVGNQDTDNVTVFRIDEKTGRLLSTGTRVEVGRPVCLRFLEPGK